MKRHILTAVVFVVSFAVSAQFSTAQTSLTKQLEVTKAYTPDVEQASKMPIEPNMVDTVKLRPESEYQITPTVWQAHFDMPKYKAARVNTLSYQKPHHVYIKAGLGYPLQSVLDLYYTSRPNDRSTFGLYANHRGSWSNIDKRSAIATTNELGIFGSKRLGRWILDGDFSIDYNHHQFYAYASPLTTDAIAFGDNGFGKLGGKIGFGDTFTDLSRLNFRVELGLDWGVFWENQIYPDLTVKFAQMFGRRHGFEVLVAERGEVDVLEPDISASSVFVAPRYLLRVERFRLDAGFDLSYIFNGGFDQNHALIAPAVKASYNAFEGRLVPFLDLTSRIVEGGSYSLMKRNPYLGWGYAPTGWEIDLRLGAAGNISDAFSYKVTAGLSGLQDRAIFVSTADSYRGGYNAYGFKVENSNGIMFTAGAELGLLPVGGFSARMFGNWYKMSLRNGMPGDVPDFDAGLELKYEYRDIFTLSAGAKVLGERKFYNDDYHHSPEYFTNTIAPVVDVTFRGEVRAAKDLWVFLEGQNLANQKLYPFNRYRGLGINFMAGVKMVF